MKMSQFNIIRNFGMDTVVFNTLYRSMVSLPNEFYEEVLCNIKEIKIDKLSENMLILKEKGMILEESTNEYKLYNYYYNLNRYNSGFLSITLLVTEKCNFKCTYCYEDNSKNHVINEDLFNNIEDVINDIYSITPFKFLDFNFFGGEPLLEINKIVTLSKRITKYCELKNIKYQMHIVTNGYLLNEKNLEILKNARIKSLQITLDGSEKNHNGFRMLKSGEGTYKKILENLLHAIDFDFEITLNINYNDSSIKSTKELLIDIPKGKRKYIFIKLNEIISSNFNEVKQLEDFDYENYESIYYDIYNLGYNTLDIDLLEDGACLLETSNTIILDSNGSISKCIYGIHDDRFEICNIKDEDWLNTFTQNDPFVRIETDEKCKTCDVLPICKEGCYKKRIDGVQYCNPKKIKKGFVNFIFYKYLKENNIHETIK